MTITAEQLQQIQDRVAILSQHKAAGDQKTVARNTADTDVVMAQSGLNQKQAAQAQAISDWNAADAQVAADIKDLEDYLASLRIAPSSPVPSSPVPSSPVPSSPVPTSPVPTSSAQPTI